MIGGIAETQEMLDFCAEHGIVSDIEMIPIQQINEAYERMLKSDVKYRFVIDMASLKEEQGRLIVSVAPFARGGERRPDSAPHTREQVARRERLRDRGKRSKDLVFGPRHGVIAAAQTKRPESRGPAPRESNDLPAMQAGHFGIHDEQLNRPVETTERADRLVSIARHDHFESLPGERRGDHRATQGIVVHDEDGRLGR